MQFGPTCLDRCAASEEARACMGTDAHELGALLRCWECAFIWVTENSVAEIACL